MALLSVLFIVVIVLHNFTYCLASPVSLTTRDSLTTTKNSPIEIVTPISPSKMAFSEEEIFPTLPYIPAEIINFPREITPIEMNNSSTEISYVSKEIYVPTEAIHFTTEISHFEKEENTTKAESKKNGIASRIPKFLGRLAFLAGLGLAGLANAASAINLDTKVSETPLTQSMPPEKLSPYFAAVYEPFSLSSQTQFFSNLIELFPSLNGLNLQKFQPQTPSPVSDNPHQQTIFTSSDEPGQGDVNGEEFYQEEYIAKNRKDYNTIEGKISDEDIMEKQANPIKQTMMNENTSLETPEEESKESENEEEIEKVNLIDENTEENEEYSESENPNDELFSAETEQITIKPSKPAKQNQRATTKTPMTNKATTKKPRKRKTTAKVETTTATNMQNTTQNNATDSGSTTGYPYFPGYYGGNPQNVHNLYITSSETPQTHESYNEISHYSDDWSNNLPIDHNSFEGFSNPYFEFRSPVIEEPTLVDTPFLRGFPVMETASPPEFINSGFRPSFRYSRSTQLQ